MKTELLKSYLKDHCLGRKRIISGAALEKVLHMSGNALHRNVNRLRQDGVPIASSEHGYFYAEHAGEVYATIVRLRKMVSTMEKAIAGLEDAMERFGEGGDSG